MRRYIYKQLYYGKTISSFDALRPLFSGEEFLHSLQNNNSNLLLFLEHIKLKKPELNSGLKASKELIVFP